MLDLVHTCIVHVRKIFLSVIPKPGAAEGTKMWGYQYYEALTVYFTL